MRIAPIRIAVAEDSLLVREGILRILGDVPDMEVVGSCGAADPLRRLVAETRPDAVVTDIRMPPTQTDEGIVVARELAETQPLVGVVVLSQIADPAYALALFEPGSTRRAYLLKERLGEPEELVRAIRTVADGGSLVDARVVTGLIDSGARDHGGLESLTPRQLEILALIAQGASNSAIAVTLMITKRAVERHVNAIFARLAIGESADVSRRVKAALTFLAANRA